MNGSLNVMPGAVAVATVVLAALKARLTTGSRRGSSSETVAVKPLPKFAV